MRSKCAAILTTLTLLATNAPALVLEIPLPAFQGTFPDDYPGELDVTVALPDIAAVNSVSFRVSGTQTLGALECDGQDLSPWPLDISATMQPLEGIAWYATEPMPLVDGAFTWTASFQSIPATGVTWDNLLDGEETIYFLMISAPVVGLCSTVEESTASVTEAVLILDYEQAVPVESATWSRIKALYQD